MHRCKTRTCPPVFIDNKTYDNLQNKILTPTFLNGCKQAQEAILQKPYVVERRLFQETFSIPMKRNLFGLLAIPVEVNQISCTFLLDTGAQISGLRSSCVKKVEAMTAIGRIGIGSVGGKEKALSGCIVKQLRMGALQYHHMPMVILDEKDFAMRFGNIDLMGFDGIIGWDVLSQLDFEMDDIAKQFKVVKNKFRFPCRNMIMGSFPVFLCQKKNQEVALFGFDSGSKVSWLSDKFIEKEQLQIICEGHAMGFGVHGFEKLPMKIVEQLQVTLDRGAITLKDTMSGRCDLFNGFTFDGVFGNEIFKGRRIRLINSKQVVLLV